MSDAAKLEIFLTDEQLDAMGSVSFSYNWCAPLARELAAARRLLHNSRDALYHTPGHTQEEGVCECCIGCLLEKDIDSHFEVFSDAK